MFSTLIEALNTYSADISLNSGSPLSSVGGNCDQSNIRDNIAAACGGSKPVPRSEADRSLIFPDLSILATLALKAAVHCHNRVNEYHGASFVSNRERRARSSGRHFVRGDRTRISQERGSPGRNSIVLRAKLMTGLSTAAEGAPANFGRGPFEQSPIKLHHSRGRETFVHSGGLKMSAQASSALGRSQRLGIEERPVLGCLLSALNPAA